MRPRRHSPTIALALALLVALLHLAGCESREPAGTSDAGTVTLDTLSADADAAHPADADAGADSAAPLAWGPCDLTKWSGTYPAPGPGVTIECTTVAVPLDHAAPEDGRRVSLMVARQLAAQPFSARGARPIGGQSKRFRRLAQALHGGAHSGLVISPAPLLAFRRRQIGGLERQGRRCIVSVFESLPVEGREIARDDFEAPAIGHGVMQVDHQAMGVVAET